MDNILLAHSLPMNTDRRKFLPLSKIRNKKKEPPSSTENSKVFDSTKQKSEPPMIREKLLKKTKTMLEEESQIIGLHKIPSLQVHIFHPRIDMYTHIPLVINI